MTKLIKFQDKTGDLSFIKLLSTGLCTDFVDNTFLLIASMKSDPELVNDMSINDAELEIRGQAVTMCTITDGEGWRSGGSITGAPETI